MGLGKCCESAHTTTVTRQQNMGYCTCIVVFGIRVERYKHNAKVSFSNREI